MRNISKDAPIGVFDSGVGGISILKELIRILPNENYIYRGDSANAPYGLKSLEQVRELTFQHTKELLEEGAKAIVVACNTATSAAVRSMRGMYPDLPLVGIEPALKPAALQKEHPKVVVMATPMTIREEKFQSLMKRFEDQAQIFPLPCPGLMEFVEAGELEGERLERFLEELLSPYLEKNIDSIVLGCTHYPFVKKTIQRLAGDRVTIFDGGAGTARRMKSLLEQANLLNPSDEEGFVQFENSLGTEEKFVQCETLLQWEI
ncbi:MAG: glutamate racemase [bacterium]|nr:glutamate racemase [bacterium]